MLGSIWANSFCSVAVRACTVTLPLADTSHSFCGMHAYCAAHSEISRTAAARFLGAVVAAAGRAREAEGAEAGGLGGGELTSYQTSSISG